MKQSSSPSPEARPPGLKTHSVDEVFRLLKTSPDGLSEQEAQQRLHSHGPNELTAGYQVSPWSILASQFKNLLIIILLIATGISAFVGHGVEAIAIAVIVLFAVVLGFIQEFRAERAIEALSKMAAPHATVIRDGLSRSILARDLVPGDLVELHAGDKVPADARVVEAANLRVSEAPLTGESVAVEKNTAPLDSEDVALGDQHNTVFAGAAVAYGRGKAAVIATGMETEFGKIAELLQTVEKGTTPLERNLDVVGRRLAQAGFAIVALIVALGLYQGRELVEMLVFGIALAVAVVPEALPAVVTISLAIGVQRMSRRHALVRRLPAVETLGSTSVICTDKTGTLTRDEMTVRRIVVGEETYEVSGAGYEPTGEITHDGTPIDPPPHLQELLRAVALCNDVALRCDDEVGVWTIQGDPTEGALAVVAAKVGLRRSELEREAPRVDEIPFTSETKRMTTIHRLDGQAIAYTKGAPEAILPQCTRRLTSDGEQELTDHDRQAILQQAERMAGDALRVLAASRRQGASRENAQQEMTFLGLVGMIDPPRDEAKAAVQECRHAGIRPIMITGDHPATAEAIARELQILNSGRLITGVELDRLSEAEYEKQADEIEVYARVSPEHKLRVVTALQRLGHVAAMTGDGVNDAPALKKSDIGIAMGINGTEVTKEAAAMTLTDDNFASIVAAIEEGRIVFGNIKKYLMYLLSSNIGELGLMAGASLMNLPLPLTAVQLLYVNLATDGLPALALAIDPPEDDLMEQKPRDPKTSLFTRSVVSLMLVGGIWSAGVNLGLFYWALSSGRSQEEAMTMTFVSLVLIQFFKAYNFRSDHLSVFHRPLQNKWLNLAVLWEMLLLIAVIYVPLLQRPFSTYAITGRDWLIVGVLSLTISPVLELAKVFVRRYDGWGREVARPV